MKELSGSELIIRFLDFLASMSGVAENQVENIPFENNERKKSCESCQEGNQVSEKVEEEAEDYSNQSNLWSSHYRKCTRGNNNEEHDIESELLIGNKKDENDDLGKRLICNSHDSEDKSDVHERINDKSESEKSYLSKKSDAKICSDRGEASEDDDESFLSCRSNSECSYYRFSTEFRKCNSNLVP